MVRVANARLPWIGKNVHRSGWPFAMSCLEPLFDGEGSLFDPSIERSFGFSRIAKVYAEPWAGVFHHPHDASLWNTQHRQFMDNEEWAKSVSHMKFGISLSTPLSEYLENRLNKKVYTVRHPTEIPAQTFSAAKFQANESRKLIQAGYFLRNTRLIYQIPEVYGFEKAILNSDKQDRLNYDYFVQQYWAQRDSRVESGEVLQLGRVSNEEYDSLFTENVVCCEVFTAAANNVVVECMARNTPLLINPHPAVVDYLGSDYPFYFRHPDQIASLLSESRVIEAHVYLKQLDKSFLTGQAFFESVKRIFDAEGFL